MESTSTLIIARNNFNMHNKWFLMELSSNETVKCNFKFCVDSFEINSFRNIKTHSNQSKNNKYHYITCFSIVYSTKVVHNCRVCDFTCALWKVEILEVTSTSDIQDFGCRLSLNLFWLMRCIVIACTCSVNWRFVVLNGVNVRRFVVQKLQWMKLGEKMRLFWMLNEKTHGINNFNAFETVSVCKMNHWQVFLCFCDIIVVYINIPSKISIHIELQTSTTTKQQIHMHAWMFLNTYRCFNNVQHKYGDRMTNTVLTCVLKQIQPTQQTTRWTSFVLYTMLKHVI